MRIIALLALAAFFCGCSDRSGETIEDPRVTDVSRPLRFITHPTDPPCAYTNAQGEICGSDVELAKKIAARMGRGLICEAVEFESLIPRLKEGTADFSIATITITDARQRDVDFSHPYAVSGNCFLYRATGPKPRMSQLNSLRVGVESGTTGDLYLCQHGGDPVRFAHMNDAVSALESGDVDAIFFDSIPLVSWAAKTNGRLVASPLETREGYGVAVDKRRPDILQAANAVIAEEGGVK